MNLIGQADDQSIIENHFIDSLTVLPLLQCHQNDRLLDIGSGAGFPGLVLQLACPALKVTLVEPRRKRAAFLNHICRTMKIPAATVLSIRIHENDTLFSSAHGPFPWITSRAVANIKEFLALAAPLCSDGSRVICMKGPQADREVEEWLKSENHHKFTLQEIRRFRLPYTQAVRNLLVFRRNL